ncbi:hypothetical protein E2C01_084248 [Portunus trituberculatus]|uniref:Uncharacterized protein n=1 Tax=Portunus trituberculatus TaxID=210409 RepID=A0A5B7J8Q8_PORTR|nr:hypothetical protein [Portunus trituberculatus]
MVSLWCSGRVSRGRVDCRGGGEVLCMACAVQCVVALQPQSCAGVAPSWVLPECCSLNSRPTFLWHLQLSLVPPLPPTRCHSSPTPAAPPSLPSSLETK